MLYFAKKILKKTPLYLPLKKIRDGFCKAIHISKPKQVKGAKIKRITFPKDLKDIQYESRSRTKIHKLAIIACFFYDGKIPEYLIYYIDKLKEINDGIILIGDCPINPDEINKIKDKVIYASFKRHGEYDFGSYKRGYFYAKNNGLLCDVQQLVMTNDSCFGPIFDLKPIFSKMKNEKKDFWGMVVNKDFKTHLQSWFLVFNRKVIESGKLENFLSDVKKEKYFFDIVKKYEVNLTSYLTKFSFKYTSFLPSNIKAKHNSRFNITGNKMVFPNYLIKNYKFPFVKVKTFSEFTNLSDQRKSTLEIIKKSNYELYEIVIRYLKNKKLLSRFNKH